MVMNATFKIKHWKSKRYARKSIKHECSVRIENSAPQDPVWQNLVMPHSDRRDGIFIRTSHTCKILIISISIEMYAMLTDIFNTLLKNNNTCIHNHRFYQ